MTTHPSTDTRAAMTEYWSRHSEKTNLIGMMLDDNAVEIVKHEQPEVTSFLPSFVDMDIVELGAGIGRFTGMFAEKAKSVLAVDFMESFIETNKVNNSKFTNIDFKCADVTTLQLTENSYDLVFTNWLLMYLDVEETKTLIQKTLSWLREDGYLFVRESCHGPSGKILIETIHVKVRQAKHNKFGTGCIVQGNVLSGCAQASIRYRDPAFYNNMFNQIHFITKDMEVFKYEKLLSKPLDSYIQIKQNQNQIVWLLRKRKTS